MKDGKSMRKRILLVLLVLLLIAGGVLVGLNWNNWFGPDTSQTDGNSPDIDPNAEDRQGTLPNGNDNGGTSDGIAIPGYKSITLKASVKEQSVSLVNPEQNNCYFVLSLILEDGTDIYKSKMIPPGKWLYKIELTKTLTAGTYENCTLKYETYRMDETLASMNGADVNVTLIVE